MHDDVLAQLDEHVRPPHTVGGLPWVLLEVQGHLGLVVRLLALLEEELVVLLRVHVAGVAVLEQAGLAMVTA